MRKKAALIVVVIALAITVASFGSSIFLVRQSLIETMSKEASTALDIANDLVSTSFILHKSNAQTVAERLAQAGSIENMVEAMREQAATYLDFMAFAVYDGHTVVAEYGLLASSLPWLEGSKYVQKAFEGQTVISTTWHNEKAGVLVMHICTPMAGGRVLSVTIPGMLFSNEITGYRLWNSGNMWMIDEGGALIAHILPEIVDARTDFTAWMKGSGTQTADAFLRAIYSADKGVGSYHAGGAEYYCAYARVKGSAMGWRIGLGIPLGENPIAKVQNRLLLLAAVFSAVSIAAAVAASWYISKPYDKITEQNHRLEELHEITRLQTGRIQEAHQRMKLMMDATPICSMLWDKDCNIFDCNEESVKRFGMKDKQDFLDQFFNLSPAYQPNGRPSREEVKMWINKVFEEGRVSFEWMHQMPDGAPMPCEMTLDRVSYDGDYIVAAYARDLREHNRMMLETLRLQNELEDALLEAQKANKAKSSFLASMSHEMRTPLNAVVGLSELILNTGEVNGETEDRLGKIFVSGMTLLGIVNDILDISKIESGKFKLHPAEYDTPSMLNDIISLNTVHIGEKPIQFLFHVDENLPARLFGDDLRVKQIFNNLLSNAFKYTDVGTVEWAVSYEKDGGDIWLVSEVRDTGVGIKPEDINKLFRDYCQVEAKTSRKAEGTGLGLSITKHLTGLMGGTIAVESEYGQGSAFSVRLRQRSVSDEPIGRETAKNLTSRRYAATKRTQSVHLTRIDLSYAHVLVVDDMPTNLDVTKGMLAPYGMRVDCAAGGQQAVDMIRAGDPRYDAVFMDHMMPGMDGVEALRVIRGEVGTDYARSVPIIALTANAIAGNENMFLQHGFQAFISKPIDMMRLDSVLRQWVRNKGCETEYGGSAEPIAPALPPKADPDGQEGPANKGLYIDGFDVAASMERFGNNEEAYVQILRSYTSNTRPLLADIGKCLAEGDLAGYAIAVHGVKGASYGIGAVKAGAYAERLESLAKAGDTCRTHAGNNHFVQYMEALLDAADAALAEYDAANAKPCASVPDPALLQELREACGAYDAGRIDGIMSRLASYTYENGGALIAWLQMQIEEMNYDEIAAGNWGARSDARRAEGVAR